MRRLSVSQRLEFIFIATANQFLSTAVHTRLFQCVFVAPSLGCFVGTGSWFVRCVCVVLLFVYLPMCVYIISVNLNLLLSANRFVGAWDRVMDVFSSQHYLIRVGCAKYVHK